MVAAEHDRGVQAVVAEQDLRRRVRLATVAGEGGRVLEAGHGVVAEMDDQAAALDAVARAVAVGAGRQRRDLVQHLAGAGDDERAARRVVAAATLGAARLGDGVGAVERVVEAAPASVGGVQRVARVQHGHDELRPRDLGDLGIDVARGDREGRRLGLQVADAAQEQLVSFRVGRPAGLGAVPLVDLGLQLVALAEERAVAGSQVAHGGGEACPKGGRLDPRARQHLLPDELIQLPRDPQPGVLDPLHPSSPDRAAPLWRDAARLSSHPLARSLRWARRALSAILRG